MTDNSEVVDIDGLNVGSVSDLETIDPHPRQCVATNSKGEPCRHWAIAGTTVCKFHGGSAAIINSGVASSRYTNGRRSKWPKSLLAKVNDMENDTQLLAMSDEIRLLDGMLADALERADAGNDMILWSKLQDQVLAFKVGLQTKDRRKQAEAFTRITDISQQGAAVATGFKQAREIIQERAKIVDREQKRLVAMQVMITSEEAVRMMMKMILIVKENVTDRESRNKIITKINQMIIGHDGFA